MAHMTGAAGPPPAYERRVKESHRDTVAYEIEMLTFCLKKVTEAERAEACLHDLFLEGFLLHYRNLIRFFSGKNHQPDDLSMHAPGEWAEREVTDDEVKDIKNLALVLEDKYYKDISKYLQHCTRLRYMNSKSWQVLEMQKELDPVITLFERTFPA